MQKDVWKKVPAALCTVLQLPDVKFAFANGDTAKHTSKC